MALADGDKHGYAIMKEAAERTDGEVGLSAGTLYGIVKRLLAAGMITESADRPASALDDSRRRYYHLEPFGLAVAQAEGRAPGAHDHHRPFQEPPGRDHLRTKR